MILTLDSFVSPLLFDVYRSVSPPISRRTRERELVVATARGGEGSIRCHGALSDATVETARRRRPSVPTSPSPRTPKRRRRPPPHHPPPVAATREEDCSECAEECYYVECCSDQESED